MLGRFGDHGVEEFLLPLAGSRHCRNDGNPQPLRQFRDIDRDPSARRRIHHVECDDDGDAQFEQLNGEIEIAIEIGGVDDIDHDPGPVVDEEIPRHKFLEGISREGIRSGQIHQPEPATVENVQPFLLFHRYARIVPYVLVRAGDAVEKSRLPAVGISGESDQVFTTGLARRVFSDLDVNIVRLIVAQAEGEVSNANGNGILERSPTLHLERRSGDQSHVPYAAAEFSGGPDP